MKYVGQARSNTSDNTAASIKSSVQAALADYQQTGELTASKTMKYTVIYAKTTDVTKKVVVVSDGIAAFETILEPIIGGDALDQDYSIEIVVDANKNPTTVTVTGAGTKTEPAA